MLRPRTSLLAAVALGWALAAPLGAQAIGQGFEYERLGQPEQAAGVYATTLRADPTNLAALLGLERVLPGLGRLPELLPLVQRALTAGRGDATPLLALELRTYAGLNELDSLAAVATRWAQRLPRDPTPWREWAIALADHQDFQGSRRVLLDGRRALGRPTALAAELAELAQRISDWPAAAAEWGNAVTEQPDQEPNAAAQLSDVPPDTREKILDPLTRGDAGVWPRRLAADLLLGWGDGARAWALMAATATDSSRVTALALWRFAGRAEAGTGPTVREARGRALARYGDMVPPTLAAHARADAARAFLDAGDRVSARAVLEQLAADTVGSASSQMQSQGALLEVMIGDGDLDGAATRLNALATRLPGEQIAGLRLMLARARIARGELDRAEATLMPDSSVAALALRGWVALYRGDLADAVSRFREAGPYAGDRADATQRSEMVALLQRVGQDQNAELGAALLALTRGDSAAALDGLRRAAGRTASPGDVLLLAGRIAARLGGTHEADAATLFQQVVEAGGTGAAPPAAELAWAQLLLREGRGTDAVPHLEHLILTYPTSAAVPEARRELERAKGAIPRS